MQQIYPPKELTYAVIGACMDVHRHLGRGFLEVVYKDALEHEFTLRGIPYEREKLYRISYKGVTLSHYYQVDFVIDEQLILEAKAQAGPLDAHHRQTINYLAASKCPLALIVNFSADSLEYKRVILTP